MKTLIIEDEGLARRRLENIITAHPILEHCGSAHSGIEAVQLINSIPVDLLLMDIQLKDMTAFEVLNKIEVDYSGKIIFVTAYNNFAIKAFEVFAIDYVLKPYTDERLLGAVERCLNSNLIPQLEMFAILESIHFPDKICIPEGKTNHLFEKDEIEWIKADGYYSKIHTFSGDIKIIRISLKHLNQLLPDYYIRISRSIIINKNYIANFKRNKSEYSIQMKSGKMFLSKSGYIN